MHVTATAPPPSEEDAAYAKVKRTWLRRITRATAGTVQRRVRATVVDPSGKTRTVLGRAFDEHLLVSDLGVIRSYLCVLCVKYIDLVSLAAVLAPACSEHLLANPLARHPASL